MRNRLINLWGASQRKFDLSVARANSWISSTKAAMALYVGQGSYINYPDPLLAATSTWPQAYYGGNLARYTTVKTKWVIFLPDMSQISAYKLLWTPYGMRPFLQTPSPFLLMAAPLSSSTPGILWMSYLCFSFGASQDCCKCASPVGGQTRVLTLFLYSILSVLSSLVCCIVSPPWLPPWSCLNHRSKEIQMSLRYAMQWNSTFSFSGLARTVAGKPRWSCIRLSFANSSVILCSGKRIVGLHS